jgi:hypothetical protein
MTIFFVTIVLYRCGHYYEEINKYNEFYFLNDKIVLILVMNSYLLWLPLTGTYSIMVF